MILFKSEKKTFPLWGFSQNKTLSQVFQLKNPQMIQDGGHARTRIAPAH